MHGAGIQSGSSGKIKERNRSVEEILRMVVEMNWSEECPENFKKNALFFYCLLNPINDVGGKEIDVVCRSGMINKSSHNLVVSCSCHFK